MLWKVQVPELPNDRCLAISRILLLERKIEKSSSLKKRYVQTINENIKDCHASILPKLDVETQSTKNINCIPHQHVTNLIWSGKIRVVFVVGVRYKYTPLYGNLQKGSGLLNNVV